MFVFAASFTLIDVYNIIGPNSAFEYLYAILVELCGSCTFMSPKAEVYMLLRNGYHLSLLPVSGFVAGIVGEVTEVLY